MTVTDWPDRCALRVAGGIIVAMILAYALYSTPGLLARWGGLSIGGIGATLLWIGIAAFAMPLALQFQKPTTLGVAAFGLIIVRVLVAIPFVQRTLGGDALFYPIIARGVLQGEGLRIYEPFIGSTLHALYPPVYPLLLAGWTAIAGASAASLSILNLAIDAAAAWMIVRLAARLDCPGAGWAAAWLYLIWPSVLLSAPVAQKEGLVALLVLAIANAWFDVRNGSQLAVVATGLLTGTLALTQPALTPLSGLVAIALLFRMPRRLFRTGLAAMLVAALAMTPWWIRNWLMFHRFVPLTSAGPVSLWIGNNPDATGNWLPTPLALRGLPEFEYAKRIGAIARTWIADHPTDFVRLTIQKFLRATGAAQAEVARLRDANPAPPAAITTMFFPVSQAAHLMLLTATAFALVRIRLQPPPLLAGILLACGVQLALFNVWFEFGERHREFVTPVMLLFVVTAMVESGKAFILSRGDAY